MCGFSRSTLFNLPLYTIFPSGFQEEIFVGSTKKAENPGRISPTGGPGVSPGTRKEVRREEFFPGGRRTGMFFSLYFGF
jgi:hypothetical protein